VWAKKIERVGEKMEQKENRCREMCEKKVMQKRLNFFAEKKEGGGCTYRGGKEAPLW